jgi:serine protease Do
MKLTVLTLTLMFHSALAQAKTWEEVYKKNKPSIPILMMGGGVCSAALVESDLLLTAGHCVWNLRPLRFVWSEKPTEVFANARVVALDKDKDIAFVAIPKQEKTPLPILDKGVTLSPGAAIATVGHPITPGKSEDDADNPYFFQQEETYLFSAGIVSGVTKADYISDLSMSPGNSGGPVFDQEGRVIGVVSRKRVGPVLGNIGYIVRNSEIQDLKAKIPKDPSYEVPWHEAKTNFHGDLGINSHRYLMDALPGKNSSITSIGLAFDVWDRLRLSGNLSTNSDPSADSFSLAYKFVFPLSNATAIDLLPGYDYLQYSWNVGSAAVRKTGTGYSLAILWTGLPLQLKYISYQIDSANYSLTTLTLPLF